MKYCNLFWLIDSTPETRAEYKRRHDEIWPEMTAYIQSTGIRNYSIWNIGDQLIEYYECDRSPELRAAQPVPEVKRRWDAYMRDILVYRPDGSAASLTMMFEQN